MFGSGSVGTAGAARSTWTAGRGCQAGVGNAGGSTGREYQVVYQQHPTCGLVVSHDISFTEPLGLDVCVSWNLPLGDSSGDRDPATVLLHYSGELGLLRR